MARNATKTAGDCRGWWRTRQCHVARRYAFFSSRLLYLLLSRAAAPATPRKQHTTICRIRARHEQLGASLALTSSATCLAPLRICASKRRRCENFAISVSRSASAGRGSSCLLPVVHLCANRISRRAADVSSITNCCAHRRRSFSKRWHGAAFSSEGALSPRSNKPHPPLQLYLRECLWG